MDEAPKDVTLVILRAILSYPHIDVAQPGMKPTDKAKFSGAFVITKEEQETPRYAAAVEAAKEAAKAEFGAKAPSIPIFGGKGAAIRTDTAGKGYPEGSVVINARNESKPGAVYAHADASGKPARIPDDKIREELFPGEIVNVQVRAYGYDKSINKGVAWSLQNIQKVGGGTRLDNRQAAEDAFPADLSAVPASLAGLV